MKIGVISDSHDRIDNLNKAIDLINKKKCEVLIHCGDLCAPFMMDELKKFDGVVHCIFGNTDDRFNTPNKAKSLGINFHGDTAKLEIDGKKILINHYPDIARAFVFTQDYDLVCHGHNHKRNMEKIDKTLLLNPGELMGRFGAISYAVYDTKTGKAQIFEIE